jgi:hypothetical protein
VLRALGRSDELAHSSIRFTIGRFTTEEDIDFAIDLMKSKVGKLRELSPLWDMFKEASTSIRSSGQPLILRIQEHQNGLLGKSTRPLRKPAQRRRLRKGR